MNESTLAADLGGTNLRMAAVSKDGDILKRVKEKTPVSKSSSDIVSVIAKAVDKFVSEMPSAPQALALAVPGTINSETGIITRAPNIPGLDGVDLKTEVEIACGLPVVLENDANAAAIGESWLGSSAGVQSSIMVTLGTGVGGGIIIDGKILRGLDGTAGEIGHLCVEPNGPKCGCGSFGCVEQFASATAIVKMANEVVSAHPESANGNSRFTGAEPVFKAAVEGNEWATKIFESQGFYLGIVLAGLINSLNPEVIVIGGGAAGAWDAFIPSLREQVQIRTYEEACARARIVPAALGDNAGILGAARLAFQTVAVGKDVVV